MVLITHVKEDKNCGIEQQYDNFAKFNKNKNLQISHLHGINESEAFKVPRKLPTVLLFRQGLSINEGPVELDRFKLMTAMDASDQKAALTKTLKDFIRQNT